ncbi:hypothetical protein E2C01_003115 [Portunus trituberculatus]|uniref:Uncharacterized protein n=1 Tax=Portunus trituberculatus TaxID=210409 RepID=A0A5B7CN47_PORTR|nr:hypothetical protein [Portunus trituberculatus]
MEEDEEEMRNRGGIGEGAKWFVCASGWFRVILEYRAYWGFWSIRRNRFPIRFRRFHLPKKPAH